MQEAVHESHDDGNHLDDEWCYWRPAMTKREVEVVVIVARCKLRSSVSSLL